MPYNNFFSKGIFPLNFPSLVYYLDTYYANPAFSQFQLYKSMKIWLGLSSISINLCGFR